MRKKLAILIAAISKCCQWVTLHLFIGRLYVVAFFWWHQILSDVIYKFVRQTEFLLGQIFHWFSNFIPEVIVNWKSVCFSVLHRRISQSHVKLRLLSLNPKLIYCWPRNLKQIKIRNVFSRGQILRKEKEESMHQVSSEKRRDFQSKWRSCTSI